MMHPLQLGLYEITTGGEKEKCMTQQRNGLGMGVTGAQA